MQYWSELYIELAELIKTNMPEIQWVDLWHEQVSFLTEELPFPTPAVFIEFNTLNIEDRGLFIQDCLVQVDCRFFFETFSDTYYGSYNQDTAISYLQELTNLHALLHGRSGKHYSQMRRISMNREDSGGAGNLYRMSFQCLVNDHSAAVLFTETENPLAEVQVQKNTMQKDQTAKTFYDIN